MHKSKHEQDSSSYTSNSSTTTDTNRILQALDEGTAKEVVKYLPLKEIAELSVQSKGNHQLFQPILDPVKALSAIVQGNPDELAGLISKNPALLFQKSQITDPAGQTFYDVSPYQLMIFLCDDDMKHQIMLLVSPMTEQMTRLRRKQYAEIDSGGADLIKMDRDPTLLAFDDVTRFVTSYTIQAQATPTTHPLLENPDGIIFYKDAITDLEYLYYANQKTKKVELIEPKAHSKKEHQALDKLYASLAEMENNSSRRSNNAEHALIAATMQYKLSRKGIQYERDGVRYCDNRMTFRLVGAYRKCIRLYQERLWDEGSEYWRQGVGQAQRGVMWVLQRICEEDRPFYPLPDFKATPFRRAFAIDNSRTQLTESLFIATHLVPALGSDFAVFKGRARGLSMVAPKRWKGAFMGVLGWGSLHVDLVAVNRLIEDAKANVVEFTRELDHSVHNAAENRHREPG